jgi:hypothetical protein
MATYTDSDLRLWSQVTQWAILGANVRRRRAVRYAGLEFAAALVIGLLLGQWLFTTLDIYTPGHGMALGALIGGIAGAFVAMDEFRSRDPSAYELSRLASAQERLAQLREAAGSVPPGASPETPPATPGMAGKVV